ncbi:fumarate hydratase C-terminal domain-containing protein [Chelativorans sp. AA-79]|uniref:fumarate hydratase C-terminal domain-containing protein n=1 Tax=Chelativorans sp. AA-79 TaxID=3028735 RepID=UPI0023F6A7BA|nr:fumarate hydratase C-terminal domain-containing protein [Chelativorans sp. AA-79]WEX10932.1 fumarate hydratase C-terminal domain-containing protein [Chelativorans sp. AA-79]
MSRATQPDVLRLTLPLSTEEARTLHLGDMALLDGEVTVTAGFVTHERVIAALEKGEELPLDLHGQAVFHMGGSCRQENGKWLPNYVNPTTSTRFDAFMPTIIRRLRLTSVGGKGGMGAECVEAMRETGCVYFSMPGGAAPLLSAGAVERLETGWDDLIEQFRLARYRLESFGPVTVAIDAHGNSMYRNLQQQAAGRLPDILRELEAARSTPKPVRPGDDDAPLS